MPQRCSGRTRPALIFGICPHACNGYAAVWTGVWWAVMPQAAVPADHVARVEFDVFCAALFYARFYEVAGQFAVNAVFVHDVRYNFAFVTARHKLHTPVFARCRVECHPRIKGFGFSVAPEAVVLMPGGCAARFGGFYKYAVEFDDDVVAQKISRQGEHFSSGVKCVPDEGGFHAEIAEFPKSHGVRFRGVAHGVHGDLHWGCHLARV